MPFANWLIWDRVREFARQNRVYQQERILQDQSNLDRITVGGEFMDFSSQSAILEQTNLQINRLERYKDYEQMDQTGEISLALDLYADEMSIIDPEHKHSIIIRADDRRIKAELEDLYYNTLLIDKWTRPAARYLSKFGDAPFEIIPDRDRSGVSSIRFMNVYNFTRVETRFGDLIGFFYQDELYPEPLFLHPWSVMHLRLTSFENIYHPYGRCVAPQTVVDTPNGPVQIKDIKPGQEVYSWDGEKAVKTKVVAKACSGKKQLWKIKTRHHELECTAEHPILIDGQGYKMAKDLKKGDRVIIPKIKSEGVLTELKLPQARNKNCKLPVLPRYIDTTFAKLFAVTLNTGWAGTLRSLGYKPHGSMHTLLKQRCQEYDIDTAHFKGTAWNKGGASTAVLESPSVKMRHKEYVTEQILSVEITDKTEEVYDIQVEGYHNFLADGIVVHNSILDGGRKAFKQLRLMEDAALIYRITRAPEKRKYKIPVGLIPPKEVPEYMQIIARMFKRQRFYNPTTGTFDERYSPMVQEDDFFLPMRPDGTGPDIEVLPGAENLDQIADIEYFKKKMVAPLKIPFSRVGIGEGSGESNEKSLSQSHAEFAKAVKWIQSEIAIGLQKIGIVHLALRGYGVDAIKGFEIALASSSALEDLYRMETWQTRVAVMSELKEIGWFPKEWIVTRFTDLSPDEIEELEEMEEEETGGGIGGPGGPMDMGDDDMGGEEGDLEDMDDEDLGGEEGGEDEEDVLAAPDEDEDALEGYDANRDKRIIMEEIKMRKRRKKKEFMQRQWDKRNAPRSSFDHFIETKELDGLSTGSTSNLSSRNGKPVGSMPHNPNSDDGLLVEWSVDKKVRDEAITEIASLIRSGTVDQDDTGEPGEISDSDLPPPV